MSGRFLSRDPIGYGETDNSLYEYCNSSPGRWLDPSGENPIVIPVVVGGGVIISEAEAIAAAAGMTLIGCLMDTGCRARLELAIKNALDRLDAAAKATLRAGCSAMHLAYKKLEETCGRCIRGEADFCLLRHWRCLSSAKSLACWNMVLGMRAAYVAAGCDILIPNPRIDHVKNLGEVMNCIERGAESVENNCFGGETA